MTFVASRGAMSLRRDAARSSTAASRSTSAASCSRSTVDGEPRARQARCSTRSSAWSSARSASARPTTSTSLCYLWTGPRSPCFGKDKMATFETYFVADKATHEETKNPYFKLHPRRRRSARACSREFGVDERAGFIVNGHVPVKLEKGETPMKQSRPRDHDRRRVRRGVRRQGLLARARRRAHLPRAAPPLRERRGGGRAGADIVPTVSDVEVYERAAHRRRHRAGRRDPRRDRRARGALHAFETQPDPRHARDQGTATAMATLLEQLNTMTVVVCDTGDINSIKKFTPRDATTNPSLITAAAQMPEYADVVDGALALGASKQAERRRRQGRRGSRSIASRSSSACASCKIVPGPRLDRGRRAALVRHAGDDREGRAT